MLFQASQLAANRSLIPTTTPTYVSSPFDEQVCTFTIGDLVVRFVVEAYRELFPSEDVLSGQLKAAIAEARSRLPGMHRLSFDAFVITHP